MGTELSRQKQQPVKSRGKKACGEAHGNAGYVSWQGWQEVTELGRASVGRGFKSGRYRAGDGETLTGFTPRRGKVRFVF